MISHKRTYSTSSQDSTETPSSARSSNSSTPDRDFISPPDLKDALQETSPTSVWLRTMEYFSREHQPTVDVPERMDMDPAPEPAPKRRRITPPRQYPYPKPKSAASVRLPSRIWQQILDYLDPEDSWFLTLEDGLPSRSSRFENDAAGVSKPSTGSEIVATRAGYQHSNLPTPLPGFSKASIWRIMFGRDCQSCHRQSNKQSPSSNPLGSTFGPGNDIIPILVFGIRVCKVCLEDHVLQESQLPGLPFPRFINLLTSVRTSTTMDKFFRDSKVAQDAAVPEFPLKLYSRHHVYSLLRSYQAPSCDGPATINRWFAENLAKVNRTRDALDNWYRYLDGHQLNNDKTHWSTLRINPHPRASTTSSDRTWMPDNSTIDPPEYTPSPSLDDQHRRSTSEVSRRSSPTDTEDGLDAVRERLSNIADNFIEGHWLKTNAINHQTCSYFAVNVLLEVRAKYFQPEGPSNGADPCFSENTTSRRLTLRHMKFVYDHKIKPLAETLLPKLFRCVADNCTNSNKTFNLEGVMMHTAKHGAQFSGSGPKKLDWDNDWPENLPFAHTAFRPASRQFRASSAFSPVFPPQALPGVSSPLNGYRQAFAPPTMAYGHPIQMAVASPFSPPPMPLTNPPMEVDEEDENSEQNRYLRIQMARRMIAAEDALLYQEQQALLQGHGPTSNFGVHPAPAMHNPHPPPLPAGGYGHDPSYPPQAHYGQPQWPHHGHLPPGTIQTVPNIPHPQFPPLASTMHADAHFSQNAHPAAPQYAPDARPGMFQ